MLQHDISISVVPGMIPVCRQDSSSGFDEGKTPADFFPSKGHSQLKRSSLIHMLISTFACRQDDRKQELSDFHGEARYF